MAKTKAAAEPASNNGVKVQQASGGGASSCFLGLLCGVVLGLGGAVGAVVAADAGHLHVPEQVLTQALAAAGLPKEHRLASLLAGSVGSGAPATGSTAACPAATPAEGGEKAKALEAEVRQFRSKLASQEAELKAAKASAESELKAAKASGQQELEARLAKAREELKGGQQAWAAEKEALQQALQEATAAKDAAVPQEPWQSAAEAGWPQCVFQDAGVRGEALVSDVQAVLGAAAAGCSEGNCQATSVFDAGSTEDCARVCAAVQGCNFWSSFPGGAGQRCQLWTGAGSGREAVGGSVAAAQGCSPPATQLSPHQVALAVLSSPALQGCDAGDVNEQCASLQDAMRTWMYGIRHLKAAMAGTSNNIDQFMEQIEGDAIAYLNTPPGTPGLAGMYPVAVANNRQVFEAVRHFLVEKAGPAISRFDVSVAPGARGQLCTAGQCEA